MHLWLVFNYIFNRNIWFDIPQPGKELAMSVWVFLWDLSSITAIYRTKYVAILDWSRACWSCCSDSTVSQSKQKLNGLFAPLFFFDSPWVICSGLEPWSPLPTKRRHAPLSKSSVKNTTQRISPMAKEWWFCPARQDPPLKVKYDAGSHDNLYTDYSKWALTSPEKFNPVSSNAHVKITEDQSVRLLKVYLTNFVCRSPVLAQRTGSESLWNH